MDLLIAIDQLDDVVIRAPGVPLTRQIRLDPERIQRAIADLRRAIDAQLGLLSGGDSAATAMRRAAQGLEELVRAAPPIPLLGGVRIPRKRARDLVDELRDAVPAAMVEHHRQVDPPEVAERYAAIFGLEGALYGARPVALTDQVRLDGGALDERVAALRAAFAGASPTPAGVEAIGTLAAAAKPVPLAPEVRLSKTEVLEHLDALRRFLEER